MRIVLRYFFRGVRLALTPVVLVAEKLSTPQSVERSDEEQARVDEACRSLALYQFRACPFCIKVRKEMARLGLKIEIRDAQLDPDHRHELEAGGGKVKVPCLLIEHEDGRKEWMYESSAINTWLHRRFGQDQAA
ncbi:glutaredoxin family protein [Billgrantia kenyensis]|uniref:Glutaredoxin n=1 Tax=Billgrantia kenyensis TaxID=321266 RepID=A0A7V9VZX3_9GAMM|nr:glutaredoxin [Halomonas kenyensis]MBA2778503.1 glutaredoxin [Halomonas kenyensis]MCG6661692.1 glutaredoxin [Halomonas kenyensis]